MKFIKRFLAKRKFNQLFKHQKDHAEILGTDPEALIKRGLL